MNKIYKLLFVLLPFVLAFPFHFIYEFIPFPIFAIYFPTNESVFEHTKLTFTTLIISYLIFYLIYKKKIDKQKYLSSLVISIAIATVLMLTLYYLYMLIFKKDVMILNIIALLLALTIAQIVAIFSYKKGITFSKEISIYSLLTLTLLFTLLTINPPALPFFFDELKQGYGVNIK